MYRAKQYAQENNVLYQKVPSEYTRWYVSYSVVRTKSENRTVMFHRLINTVDEKRQTTGPRIRGPKRVLDFFTDFARFFGRVAATSNAIVPFRGGEKKTIRSRRNGFCPCTPCTFWKSIFLSLPQQRFYTVSESYVLTTPSRRPRPNHPRESCRSRKKNCYTRTRDTTTLLLLQRVGSLL